jgi:phosphoenolpyruvate---glycerone phosphotransferase subunit DhaL
MPEVTAEGLERWLRRFAEVVHDHAAELTELDSAIGDADHGSNMRRGMTAVVAKLDAAPDVAPAALLKTAGMTLVSTVGGASGPLYGTLFLRMGTSAGDRAELDAAAFAAALRAGLEGVLARGKAQLGDKTMVDALTPAVDALDAALADGAGLGDALRAAAGAADKGSDATIPLVARKGRASYLGERSAGHRDPGATSTALLVNTAAASLG